jgi:hypothetical protein
MKNVSLSDPLRFKRNSSVRKFLPVSPLHCSHRAHYDNYITGSHSSTAHCSASCLCPRQFVIQAARTRQSFWGPPSIICKGFLGLFSARMWNSRRRRRSRQSPSFIPCLRMQGEVPPLLVYTNGVVFN